MKKSINKTKQFFPKINSKLSLLILGAVTMFSALGLALNTASDASSLSENFPRKPSQVSQEQQFLVASDIIGKNYFKFAFSHFSRIP